MFLLVVNVVVLCMIAVVLGLVTLLQKPKGEVMSPMAVNSNMQQLLGVSQMPSFLERLTYVVFVGMVVLTLSLTHLVSVEYADM